MTFVTRRRNSQTLSPNDRTQVAERMTREAGFSAFEALDWESDMNACESLCVCVCVCTTCVLNCGAVCSRGSIEEGRGGALRCRRPTRSPLLMLLILTACTLSQSPCARCHQQNRLPRAPVMAAAAAVAIWRSPDGGGGFLDCADTFACMQTPSTSSVQFPSLISQDLCTTWC